MGAARHKAPEGPAAAAAAAPTAAAHWAGRWGGSWESRPEAMGCCASAEWRAFSSSQKSLLPVELLLCVWLRVSKVVMYCEGTDRPTRTLPSCGAKAAFLTPAACGRAYGRAAAAAASPPRDGRRVAVAGGHDAVAQLSAGKRGNIRGCVASSMSTSTATWVWR